MTFKAVISHAETREMLGTIHTTETRVVMDFIQIITDAHLRSALCVEIFADGDLIYEGTRPPTTLH